MAVELYTQEKPGVPYRTWYVSVILLFVASVLAGAMTWQRSGDLLAPRIEPEGWSISFCPPQRLGEREFGSTRLGPAFRFAGALLTGAETRLAVYRLEHPDNADPLAVCEQVLGAYIQLRQSDSGMTRLVSFGKKLGPLDAVEIQDTFVGVVVRAAVLAPDEAYAVSLGVNAPMIDEQAYRLFERTCASIEHRRP